MAERPQTPRDTGLRSDNLRMVGKLAVVAALMFGFGYALVPFYYQICKAWGVGVMEGADGDGAWKACHCRCGGYPRAFTRV